MKKILITGGSGFLGKSVVEDLLINKWDKWNDIIVCRKKDFDLTNNKDVKRLYSTYKPNAVIHLAAEVGGIGANMANPGRFFYANIAMGINMVENARIFKVEKFVFVSTVCSYPKFCKAPFLEESIWDGYPEETNAPYGIAKKSIMVMLQSYKKQYGLKSCVLVPTNLYGPFDNFKDDSSHVIPSLIKKFVGAKLNNEESVTCWGSGKATREFLYVDDCARGIVDGLEYGDDLVPFNLGGGVEISMWDLAYKIKDSVGYKGSILWDKSKPDGQPRRLLNCDRAADILGWGSMVSFDEGLEKTVDWYEETLKGENNG